MARKAPKRRGGRAEKEKPEPKVEGRKRPRPAWRRPLPVAVFGVIVLVGAAIVGRAISPDSGGDRLSRTSIAIAQLPSGPSTARVALPPIEETVPPPDRAAQVTAARTPPQEEEDETAPTAHATEEDPATAALPQREEQGSVAAALPQRDVEAETSSPPAESTTEAPARRDAAPASRDERVAALPPVTAPSPPPVAGDGLALAPDPDLITEGQNGPLPVISPDGRRAWQVYARPFDGPKDRPRIAIMLAGLGLSRSATKTAIQQLPGQITLGFAPYARGLEAWVNEARAAGHEVFLDIPMEPYDYPHSDPGPHTLLTTLDDSENIDRLDWLLSRTAGYVGVTTFSGDKFTSTPKSVEPVLEALRDRGLMFLDARTSRDSVAGDLAAKIELPRALNNRFLDNEASRIAIDARLLELEEIARSVGYAVGIGLFPYPVTMERIARWSATLDEKGITLAPMSAIANLQKE